MAELWGVLERRGISPHIEGAAVLEKVWDPVILVPMPQADAPSRTEEGAVSIAEEYQNQGLDLPDLIQQANLGLMHAVKKFDYATGCKFSTYASRWIQQNITLR